MYEKLKISMLELEIEYNWRKLNSEIENERIGWRFPKAHVKI